MENHSFIFNTGNWIGEGKIILNMVEEELFFNTQWAVPGKDLTGKVSCAQDIQVHGLSESMRNELTFYDFSNKNFSVDMENQNVGRIVGTGVFDEKVIAWEFRNNDMDFEGFETYALQSDGSYLVHGEYVTSDQFRTQIEARIWEKGKELPNQLKKSEEES